MQYHPNLNAYSGVEDLSNFTPEQFSAYCKVKLGECGKHIDFIKKNILSILPKPKRLTIAEIGSGNSKLLYRLELENLLTSAIGFELSESRHEFAEKFGIHVNAQKTKNVCASFLDYPPLPPRLSYWRRHRFTASGTSQPRQREIRLEMDERQHKARRFSSS